MTREEAIDVIRYILDPDEAPTVNELIEARDMAISDMEDMEELESRSAKHWLDDADRWICPRCGHESLNPNDYLGRQCPVCGFQAVKDENTELCPFCKKKVSVMYYWKEGWFTCGCRNDKCMIRPMSGCKETSKEAIRAWNGAFVV